MKLIYNILKKSNHWFTTLLLILWNEIEIIKFIYNFYFFYKSDLLEIVKIETNNILIANNIFTNNIKIIIKVIKIIIKDYKYFIFIQLIKFNKI